MSVSKTVLPNSTTQDIRYFIEMQICITIEIKKKVWKIIQWKDYWCNQQIHAKISTKPDPGTIDNRSIFVEPYLE